MKSKNCNSHGFSLVEIIVAVAMLGLGLVVTFDSWNQNMSDRKMALQSGSYNLVDQMIEGAIYNKIRTTLPTVLKNGTAANCATAPALIKSLNNSMTNLGVVLHYSNSAQPITAPVGITSPKYLAGINRCKTVSLTTVSDLTPEIMFYFCAELNQISPSSVTLVDLTYPVFVEVSAFFHDLTTGGTPVTCAQYAASNGGVLDVIYTVYTAKKGSGSLVTSSTKTGQFYVN